MQEEREEKGKIEMIINKKTVSLLLPVLWTARSANLKRGKCQEDAIPLMSP